jgi:prophage regulatory protein
MVLRSFEMEQRKPKRFIRRCVVEEITGLPTSSLYLEMSKGRFPKPVPIGDQSVAWIEDEVLAWQEARIAQRDVEAA